MPANCKGCGLAIGARKFRDYCMTCALNNRLADLGDDEWMKQAACVDADPGEFFPPKSRGRHDQTDPYNVRERYCAPCAVSEQCLNYALNVSQNNDEGIWGGTTEADRRRLRKRIRRQAA